MLINFMEAPPMKLMSKYPTAMIRISQLTYCSNLAHSKSDVL